MFYFFLLLVAAMSIAVYLLFIVNVVPGTKEQRLGVLEDLPANLGHWSVEETANGQVREVRHIFHEGSGLFSQGKVIHQVRYRDKVSGEIVRVDPEQVVKRKRVKKA
jgi:hypothetical protein